MVIVEQNRGMVEQIGFYKKNCKKNINRMSRVATSFFQCSFIPVNDHGRLFDSIDTPHWSYHLPMTSLFPQSKTVIYILLIYGNPLKTGFVEIFKDWLLSSTIV